MEWTQIYWNILNVWNSTGQHTVKKQQGGIGVESLLNIDASWIG